MLYTCTYPLLCKMNFISIIIINVVRGHNGGKQTDIHRVNEKEPFHCIILTHFCRERREICNHFLILLLLYSTRIYYKLFYPRDPNVRAHMHTQHTHRHFDSFSQHIHANCSRYRCRYNATRCLCVSVFVCVFLILSRLLQWLCWWHLHNVAKKMERKHYFLMLSNLFITFHNRRGSHV